MIFLALLYFLVSFFPPWIYFVNNIRLLLLGSFWIIIYNDFILFSRTRDKMLCNYFRIYISLIVLTRWAFAVSGAFFIIFFTSTVIAVTWVFAMTSLLHKFLPFYFNKKVFERILVNLLCFLYYESSNVFIFISVKTTCTLTVSAAFSISLKTRTMQSKAIWILALTSYLCCVAFYICFYLRVVFL